MATKNAKSATSEKASVKSAKDTAVKAADVKPAVKDATAKAVPAKEVNEKKAEEKPAVKTETAPKKEAASKETTAKKTATKKKEITTTVRIQYLGKDVAVKDKVKEIKAIWQKAGNRVRDIKDIELYVKPEDNKIYFVVNGDFDGSVDM